MTVTVPVSPPALGTITIIKRTTVPTAATFAFTLGGSPFTLGRDGTRTYTDLIAGTYSAIEVAQTGWQLSAIACTDTTGDSVVTVSDRRAAIALAPGETVTCTFTNRPSGTLPATGTTIGQLLLVAAVALSGGAGLLLIERRRRRLP